MIGLNSASRSCISTIAQLYVSVNMPWLGGIPQAQSSHLFSELRGHIVDYLASVKDAARNMPLLFAHNDHHQPTPPQTLK